MTEELIERLRANSPETAVKVRMRGARELCGKAADRIESLTEALRKAEEALHWYRNQMCEGFCEGFTPDICQAVMDESPTGGDCSGCRAVIALSSIATKGEGSNE